MRERLEAELKERLGEELEKTRSRRRGLGAPGGPASRTTRAGRCPAPTAYDPGPPDPERTLARSKQTMPIPLNFVGYRSTATIAAADDVLARYLAM